MRIKRSAEKARQKRDRNRRLAARNSVGNRSLRCEPLESRVLLDAGGLLPQFEPVAPDPRPAFGSAAISGRVWEDLDGNRQYNGNELGMGGVTIYSDLNFNGILEEYEPRAVTTFDDPVTDFDEGGLYTLANLQPGYHNVRQVTPNGFEQTFPSLPDGYLPPPWGDPSVHVTFVEQGQTVDEINFGNKEVQPSAVHGFKWEDTNGNGERDADELGLSGVIIFSDSNLNGVLDPGERQTVTSADNPDTDFDETGHYSLENLESGWHWIKEVVPDGFRQTFPGPWIPPVSGPEVSGQIVAPPPVGGVPHDVFLLPGQTVDGIDFGNQRTVPGSVYGVKWEDVDGNGERGADEQGLAGVTIYSDLNFNAQLDPEEPQTVSMADNPLTDFDESGMYWLDVEPGFHVIREVVPDGYRQTYPLFDYFFPAITPADVGILPPQGDAHFVTVEPAQAIGDIDFGNQELLPGSISGVKWEDSNGNAEFDPWESGLAGVTIYADLNNNGSHEADEPSAITTADIPETDFDEAGRYTLSGLAEGDYFIREVVPDGFRQTYPLNDAHLPLSGRGTEADVLVEEFATVSPEMLELDLAAGEVFATEVSISVHPNIFVAMELEVIANSANVELLNLSGPQSNGGGGDVSSFEIMLIGDGNSYDGELQFIDLAGGSVVAAIPLWINTPTNNEDGAHRVWLSAGDQVTGIDFGNQRDERPPTGSVGGRKWEDVNGNGERDPNEPGLGGVTIYADHNFNSRLDPGEPSTVTSYDIPETDFDEAGLYSLETITGFQAIRENVPLGFVQTFPISDAASPQEQGAHFVNVEANSHTDGLDFGNQRDEIPPSGNVSGTKWEDANGNGQRDGNEVGLGGVTIYSDLNSNHQFDPGEPHAVTEYDIPETDFDEGGLYTIRDLASGFHVIREVVPIGFVQTFPISIAASPLETGAHYVLLVAGGQSEGLDFGNQRLDVPLPGDFNGDGVVDAGDLEVWQAGFGPNDTLATDTAGGMDGADFLDWQRNLGAVSSAATRLVAASVATETPSTQATSSAVDRAGRPVGSSSGKLSTKLRSRLNVRETLFAEATDRTWRSSPLPYEPVENSTRPTREVHMDQTERQTLADAIDAVLASEFG